MLEHKLLRSAFECLAQQNREKYLSRMQVLETRKQIAQTKAALAQPDSIMLDRNLRHGF